MACKLTQSMFRTKGGATLRMSQAGCPCTREFGDSCVNRTYDHHLNVSGSMARIQHGYECEKLHGEGVWRSCMEGRKFTFTTLLPACMGSEDGGMGTAVRGHDRSCIVLR